MSHKISSARVVVVLVGLAVCFSAVVAAQRGGRGRGSSAPASSILEDGDVTIKPPFSNAPELIINNAIPHGEIHRFTMKSADSKIYKGVARGQTGVVPYERPVAVYVPAQYVQGTAAPFIVVQDGYNPKYALTVPTILDNLI